MLIKLFLNSFFIFLVSDFKGWLIQKEKEMEEERGSIIFQSSEFRFQISKQTSMFHIPCLRQAGMFSVRYSILQGRMRLLKVNGIDE
jgi:hypothetical protein